ncbi:MAG: hypothetical protein OER85_16655 [Gammaproteobacteria bacterium]|nr:hypothetical protein [Gammaproteobacteria bacterium]
MQPDWWKTGDGERGLFYGLLVIHLLPLWLFTYLPTQDGPAHLYNARILSDWYSSDFPVFRDYLTLNERFDPTWFGHLILAGLMKLFSPAMSQKLFLTIYVVAFPVSIRYALGAVNNHARFLAVLGFPFIYNAVFHYGFFSFSMSLAVYCFFIGYWLRHVETLDWRKAAGLVLISVLLYFTHVISMALAYVSAAVISATWWIARIVTLQRANRLDRGSLGDTSWNLLVKPALTLLPALALLFLFLSDRESAMLPGPGFHDRLEDFVHLGVLYVFQAREHVLSDLWTIVFWALILWFIVDDWGRRKLQRQDVLLLLALVFTAVYFFAPDPVIVGESGTPGGAFTKERLNLFPFLILLFWLGTREFSPARKRFVQIAGAAIAIAFMATHVLHYRTINRQLDEYLSAIEKVESGSTLLPLFASHRGLAKDGTPLTRKVDPFLHASNLAGAERPILVLVNYEANLGYFPVKYRLSRDPYIHIGEIESAPPKVNLLNYASATGGRIDYVLVWLGQKRNTESPEMRSVYNQLDREFRRIFVSKNGLAELYQHIPAAP